MTDEDYDRLVAAIEAAKHPDLKKLLCTHKDREELRTVGQILLLLSQEVVMKKTEENMRRQEEVMRLTEHTFRRQEYAMWSLTLVTVVQAGITIVLMMKGG